jgi:hypothetical protein
VGGCRFVRCGMGGELWTGLGGAEWDVRRRGWEEGGKVRAAVVVVVVERSTRSFFPLQLIMSWQGQSHPHSTSPRLTHPRPTHSLYVSPPALPSPDRARS